MKYQPCTMPRTGLKVQWVVVVQSHNRFKPNFLWLGQFVLRLSWGCDNKIFETSTYFENLSNIVIKLIGTLKAIPYSRQPVFSSSDNQFLVPSFVLDNQFQVPSQYQDFQSLLDSETTKGQIGSTPVYSPHFRRRGGGGKISALLGFWGRILVPATAFSVVFKGFWTAF